MKNIKNDIETWATWGGAALFVLLAVVALIVLRVGLPAATAPQAAEPDPTQVAERLEEILAVESLAAPADAHEPSQPAAPAQAPAVAAPVCDLALEIGELAFAVETITVQPGGWQIPADAPDTAYFVEDSSSYSCSSWQKFVPFVERF
jgi:hypothetical protein